MVKLNIFRNAKSNILTMKELLYDISWNKIHVSLAFPNHKHEIKKFFGKF